MRGGGVGGEGRGRGVTCDLISSLSIISRSFFRREREKKEGKRKEKREGKI